MGQISLDSCDRIRELFSVSLDGERELAELEDARLRAHLARCAGCRAYADGAAAAARLVRAAPLEQPSFPIVVPGRRRAVARRLQGVAAAAAVAATIGLSVAIGSLAGPGREPAHHATQSAKLRFPDQELRMLKSASHAASRPRLAL
ncbi:MAG TPA: zf-HC2 domain-containing protein [Gaiellaceae bacterium]|nr:zf-HC2 domain-containing protein [Gaiellaceae bacterium]